MIKSLYSILSKIINPVKPQILTFFQDFHEVKFCVLLRENTKLYFTQIYPPSQIYAAEREEHCRWPTVLINRTQSHSHTVLLTQMTYRPVHQDTQPSAEVDPLGPTVQIWVTPSFIPKYTKLGRLYCLCWWISYGSDTTFTI